MSPPTIDPEKSDELNQRLVRRFRMMARGAEDATYAEELAAEFGVTIEVVHKRMERIRKRGGRVPPPPCDCDENGPCLRHFEALQSPGSQGEEHA